MNDIVQTLTARLGEYLVQNDAAAACDALLVLGHWDLKVPRHAAELMRDAMAPIAIISGSRGKFTNSQLEPEATVFRRVMESLGTPHTHILEERKATNTGENIDFALQLAADLGLNLRKWGLVTRGLQSRRTYLTFVKRTGLPAISLPPANTLTADLYGDEIDNLRRVIEEVEKFEIYTEQGIMHAPPLTPFLPALEEARDILNQRPREI